MHIMTIIDYHNPYIFYLCSVIWMQIQVIVQIQNFSLNLDGFFLKHVLCNFSQYEVNEKASSFSFLLLYSLFNFNINTDQKGSLTSNFAEDSRN